MTSSGMAYNHYGNFKMFPSETCTVPVFELVIPVFEFLIPVFELVILDALKKEEEKEQKS